MGVTILEVGNTHLQSTLASEFSSVALTVEFSIACSLMATMNRTTKGARSSHSMDKRWMS